MADIKKRSSPARVQANDRYNKKVYESIGLRVKKGTRSVWKAYADRFGLSLASLICKAVEEYIQNHSGGDSID